MSPSLQSRVVRLDNSRYHGPHRELDDVSLIVMHGTAGESAMSSVEWLDRPDSKHRASYHYIIDRDGTIYRHTAPSLIAYHAGDSCWPNPTKYPPGNRGLSVNSISLGIAFANREDGEEITDLQDESGLWLCRYWMDRLDIRPSRVVGHKDVSPGRKLDPRSLSLSEWRQKLVQYQPWAP